MNRFSEKVALVTGGGAGIGRAAALKFANEGAKVAVADIALSDAEQTVAMIEQAGGQAIAMGTDVREAAQIEAMVDRTIGVFGQLNIGFNNAGIEGAPFVRITDYPEDIYDQVMDVNVKGVWLCMKHQIAHFMEVGGGVIVNTASVAGLVGGPSGSPYFASKHAVVGMTRAVAIEYAKKNIRINAVCPAVIRTRMFEDSLKAKPEAEPTIVGMHPIGRLGQPEEVAEAVLYLASDAASFMTGHAMPVDGGLTAY